MKVQKEGEERRGVTCRKKEDRGIHRGRPGISCC